MKVDPKAQERLGAMLFYGIVIALAYFVYRIFEPFLVPLAWAVVLVVLANPVFERLARRWGRTRAALATTAGVTLVLIVPALWALYAFAQQGLIALHSVQYEIASGKFQSVNHAWDHLQQRFPQIGDGDLPSTLRQWGEAGAEFVAAKLGTIAAHAAVFLFDLFVTVLVMFYLFRDSDAMLARLRAVLPFPAEQRDAMLKETENLIVASVISTAAAAGAQGALGALAFAAIGSSAAIFWGVMIAFFSLIPVVGSALIWLPAAVTLMIRGHVTKGIAMLVFYALVILFVDYVLRPWLISGRTEMGGLVIFISVLGGVELFGLLGIVLGPIIVALAASLMDLYAPPARRGNKIADAHAK